MPLAWVPILLEAKEVGVVLFAQFAERLICLEVRGILTQFVKELVGDVVPGDFAIFVSKNESRLRGQRNPPFVEPFPRNPAQKETGDEDAVSIVGV